jgi:NADPH:quinone reductase-like Zn-dependent oxidoreductase
VEGGDEVFGLGHGAAAEFALLDHFALKPAGMNWEQAGGLATVSETAVRALELINPAPGQTEVVTIADFTAAEHGVQLTAQTSTFHARQKATRLFEEGRLTITIDSDFALADAGKAHERREGGHVRGKIVLRVTEG